MSTRSIAVVTAGLSTPSSSRILADELAAEAVRQLGRAGEQAEVAVIELRGLAHPMMDGLLTGFPGAELRAALEAVANADGLIAVTPIFSASYSSLFKAFFDVMDADALAGKPVLVAATGGTERHSLALDHALRPLFGYLRAHVVPTAVYAASADFGAGPGDTAGLAERIRRAASEFATLIASLPRRQQDDRFRDIVPLEQLLAG